MNNLPTKIVNEDYPGIEKGGSEGASRRVPVSRKFEGRIADLVQELPTGAPIHLSPHGKPRQTEFAGGARMKPNEYRECYTVTHEIPYQIEEGQLKGAHPGTGILQIGRVVWIREHPEQKSSQQRTWAYAEGVGVVSLESSSLAAL